MKSSKRLLYLYVLTGSIVLTAVSEEPVPVTDAPEPPKDNPYRAASTPPPVLPATAEFLTKAEPAAPDDEAKEGKTMLGTPVEKRGKEQFPAESRDLFWQMDQRATGTPGELAPLNFDTNNDGKLSSAERDPIRGRNTWLMWGAGNEEFWGWLSERSYGLVDFLILLDSRERETRYKDKGIINQPGMKSRPDDRILGLYLDTAAGGENNSSGQPWIPFPSGGGHPGADDTYLYGNDPSTNPWFETELFPIGDRKLYDRVLKKLPYDGVDPTIYGYPSGVVGLRLHMNPDFFGSTNAAARAREYWNERVEENEDDEYYTNPEINADPDLVRPFRVSMACAYCHVGPHPMNPPSDNEAPGWSNLSSNIGAQHWKPRPAFGNLLDKNNFLYHYLNSQQPGTIDTSLVSTDHINNSNTMNAVFDVPARLARAARNDAEYQNSANLLVASIEDGNKLTNPRHTPRVLLDGSDSIGAFGALIRVYLNIGTYSRQWNRCDNPIIGFTPQRPFSIANAQEKSVYWQTNEKYRTDYLASLFTYVRKPSGDPVKGFPPSQEVGTGEGGRTTVVLNPAGYQNATGPMKLVDTPEGKLHLSKFGEEIDEGRAVWLRNCAICHSSKQPKGFDLTFRHRLDEGVDWRSIEPEEESSVYTLPANYADWDAFRESPAFEDYRTKIFEIATQGAFGSGSESIPENATEAFYRDNFLSNEIRIPLTLVGTNSGRAVATNAMRGQIWDNFSSEDYKNLPAVGGLGFYNPFSERDPDKYGNNDVYYPYGGGPGYYRPATHIGLWATAPFFHNNALGKYSNDATSVDDRLDAYDDAIRKLLWNDLRRRNSGHPGDLRGLNPAAANDPGYIYRNPNDTAIRIERRFIHNLLTGVLGAAGTMFLSFWLWVILFALFALLALKGRFRHAAIVFLIFGLLVATIFGFIRLPSVTSGALWLVPLSLLLISALFFFPKVREFFAELGTGVLKRVRWFSWIALFTAVLVTVVVVALVFLGSASPCWLLVPVLFIALAIAFWLRWIDGPVAQSMSLIAAKIFVFGIVANLFINGQLAALSVGPIPKGTPVNLLMNSSPEAPVPDLLNGVAGLVRGQAKVWWNNLYGNEATAAFLKEAGPGLIKANKCPDYVLDRGHWFGEGLSDDDKESLVHFLKTL